MKAVVLRAHHEALAFVENHPEPRRAGGKGVILDVTACGVCHSDLHAVDAEFGKAPPLVLGHEVTGIHHDLGPVIMYAPWGCRDCTLCQAGFEMVCPQSKEAGLFADGGYAERIGIPDISYLAPIGDLDMFDAAPLACGGLTAYRAVLHGIERLRMKGQSGRALVIGAGGLGQYAIRLLRILTDASVTALDLSPSKLVTARSIGAVDAVAELDPSVAPFDLVIDFIGAGSTLQTASEHVARLGIVAVVGLAGGTIPFGFGTVPLEASFISSVWGSRAQLDELIVLAHAEPDLVQAVEVLPLSDAQVAHDRLRSGDFVGRMVLDIGGIGTSTTPRNPS